MSKRKDSKQYGNYRNLDPSGGFISNIIVGQGVLNPGTYTARVTMKSVYDTYAVLNFTIATGDTHSEVMKLWPSWIQEGMDVSLTVGLTPGVITRRNGNELSLADSATKEPLSPWFKNMGELMTYFTNNKLKMSKPTITELRHGSKVYTLAKAKLQPSHSDSVPNTTSEPS